MEEVVTVRLFINIFLVWVLCTISIVGWRFMTNAERIDLMKCVGWGLLSGVAAGVVLTAAVYIF